jgi:hypothetical protein
VTLQNNTITLTTTAASGTLYGVLGVGGPVWTITGNQITLAAPNATSSNTLEAIQVLFSSAQTSSFVQISGNTLLGPKGSATGFTGHGIDVGNDVDASPAGNNSLTGVKVFSNTIDGFNHGIIFAWITGAYAYGNLIQNVVIGLVAKLTTSCLYSGNIVASMEGTPFNAALRGKADTNSIFANNLVLIDSSCATTEGMYASQDSNTPQNGSGTQFVNNSIFGTTQVAVYALVDSGGTTATFKNNNYFALGGNGATAWNYAGTTYATLAAWAAAHETTATGVDPTFMQPQAGLMFVRSGDYRVRSSNATLYRAGAFVDFATRDARGRPFAQTPTVGAYEVAAGDLAVTRSRRSGY